MVSKTQIKFIKSLQNKKHRQRHNLFVAEGPKVINELIQCPIKIHSLYSTSEGLQMLKQNTPDFPIYEISPKTLKQISFLKNPNNILALAEITPDPPAEEIYNKSILLALDRIRDPGNLGTIIRTADWFGISGILCSHETVDAYNPKVVQSAMGSLFRSQLQYGNLSQILKDQQAAYQIYSSTLEGYSIGECDLKFPAIVVIGNESQGIASEIRENAHENISIPKYGNAESLNASVSTAILLHHFKKEEKSSN